MSDINFTQNEADALIAMEKHRADNHLYDFPSRGGSISAPLRSSDKREQFLLELTRGRIDLLNDT